MVCTVRALIALARCRVTSACRTLATRNGLVEELGCWKGCVPVPVPLRCVLSPRLQAPGAPVPSHSQLLHRQVIVGRGGGTNVDPQPSFAVYCHVDPASGTRSAA